MKDFLLFTFIYTYKGVAYDEIYEKGHRGIPEAFLYSLKLALEASQRHSALFPLTPGNSYLSFRRGAVRLALFSRLGETKTAPQKSARKSRC